VTPTIALAGNPNTGKTSLFNELTGAHQHVGNWPGKTVEQQTGEFEVDGRRFDVIDLPGTYGLLAVSAEEAIAAGFLVDRPDVVITVVDAANLERVSDRRTGTPAGSCLQHVRCRRATWVRDRHGEVGEGVRYRCRADRGPPWRGCRRDQGSRFRSDGQAGCSTRSARLRAGRGAVSLRCRHGDRRVGKRGGGGAGALDRNPTGGG